MRVRSGLEELLTRPGRLRGQRLGLIANPASITSGFVHASLALQANRAFRLCKLFGPEHGLWGDAQDLIEVGDSHDRRTGLPVFSLYGETRRPTPAMLEGLDALLFDLQDVGSRYYTFIYTLLYALQACDAAGIQLVVLDRPNPIDGVTLEGNVIRPSHLSFVGQHPLAVRHGMTAGELAQMFCHELGLGTQLLVVRMRGWRREMTFEQTGLPWVQPSPNMPTVDTAHVYPGGCLIEGTNLSEGRGTTRPFELVGAPWLDPWKLARDLRRKDLPGTAFRPVVFTPTFQKHAGQACGGVMVHVTDRRVFQPFLTYLCLIAIARKHDPERFAWRQPPYEYETAKLPIDILCGTGTVRLAIEAGASPRRMAAGWARELAGFRRRRTPFLLY